MYGVIVIFSSGVITVVMVKGVIALNFVRVNTGSPWIVMVNAFLSLKFHVANIILSFDLVLFSFSEAFC